MPVSLNNLDVNIKLDDINELKKIRNDLAKLRGVAVDVCLAHHLTAWPETLNESQKNLMSALYRLSQVVIEIQSEDL